VVGYGGNLVTRPRGERIDSCEIVIRLGMVPLDPYAKEAGSKNDFVWIRNRKLRKTGHIFIDKDMYGFDIRKLQKRQLPKLLLYNNYQANGTGGWPVLSWGGDLSLPIDRALRKRLRIVTPDRTPPDPTSGTLLPFILLYSGYCSKIDLFGISADMGGRYWDISKSQLAGNHNTALELSLWNLVQTFEPTIRNVSVVIFP